MRVCAVSVLRCVATVAVLLAAEVVLRPVAMAATFTVNDAADVVDANPGDGVCETAAGNGVCTLRAAIQEANALPGYDQISLPAGTYTLALANPTDDYWGLPIDEDAAVTGDLDITEDLDIDGAGASAAIVDGNSTDRVFEIGPGATISLSGITVQGGRVLPMLGDVGDEGEASEGGGISNAGILSVTDCRIRDNKAWPYSSLDDSFGGGVMNSGTLVVSRSTIENNQADLGGGMYNTGTATVTDSTLRENFADGGGGISNGGMLTVTNSTISGNIAVGFPAIWGERYGGIGGGIEGSATLINSTVTGNSAWNIANLGGGLGTLSIHPGPFTIKNTIIAGNDAVVGGDCFPAVVSQGNNLDSDGSCGLTTPGDLSNTDPLLGPLQDNGGPTPTHALLAGSPAIDAGDDAACPATDQRGVPRPQWTACDMGAYEYEDNLPCGDGVLDAGEQCDDGNRRAGDCCSVTCQFEASSSPCDADQNTCTIDACDGAGTCVLSSYAALGVPCEADSDLCTMDHCDGSGSCITFDTVTCQPAIPPCEAEWACSPASGQCVARPAPLGTACEADGDLCTNDHCNGNGACVLHERVLCALCETCDPDSGSCVSDLRTTCHQPVTELKALLVLKQGRDDTKDRLIWKWTRGEKTEVWDFGHPYATDDYALCIFEAVGGSPSVLLRATAPAGGWCAGWICWAAGSTGFRYKDRERTPDGLDQILLRAGDDGRAKVIVKGRGANLALPSPLDVELPLTVQLHAANGECWSASYFSAGVKKDEPDLFKAKAGSPSSAFVDSVEGLF